MKNSNIIINAVLALAIVILYILYFSSPQTTPSPSSSSEISEPAVDTAQTAPKEDKLAQSSAEEEEAASKILPNIKKIAFVNTDTLLLRYNLYQTRETQLKARFKGIEADIRNRQKVLEEEYISFNQAVNAGQVSQSDVMAKQEELIKKRDELIKYEQTQNAALIEEENRMNKELNEKVVSFVAKYAKEKGYDYIFSFSLATVAAGVIYGDKAYDVTNEVLEGLNAQ